ncbi:hypothetical protein Droror1_Dr00020077 [Drosera rotundifolia]
MDLTKVATTLAAGEGGTAAALVPARCGWTRRRWEAARVERSGVVMCEDNRKTYAQKPKKFSADNKVEKLNKRKKSKAMMIDTTWNDTESSNLESDDEQVCLMAKKKFDIGEVYDFSNPSVTVSDLSIMAACFRHCFRHMVSFQIVGNFYSSGNAVSEIGDVDGPLLDMLMGRCFLHLKRRTVEL